MPAGQIDKGVRRAEQISRLLKLRHLKVLAAVVNCGSMGKAAEQLAVSQPVISKTIADLEQLVGLRLLERGPRGIAATVYGNALLKRSVSIFADLRASIDELESLAHAGAGELRIGCSEVMGTRLVPAIVNGLAGQYPRIVFEVLLGDPVTLLDHLRGRRVDLIMGHLAPGAADDLDITVLYHQRLHVVAGAASPWHRRRKLALDDLVDERWVLPPPDHPVGALLIEAFRSRGLPPPRRVVTVTSSRFTSSLVAGGDFLGVLGSAGLADPRAPVRPLPVALPTAIWPISVATLKHRLLTPVAKLFMDHAEQVTRPLAAARRARKSSRD
jgi:DNA-binding transcriptional LysR family regulator